MRQRDELDAQVGAVKSFAQQLSDNVELIALGVGHDRGIAFRFAHLDELAVVPDAVLEFAHVLDGSVEFVALAHDLTRLGGVVPEIGRF
jgi:hypothetical protein